MQPPDPIIPRHIIWADPTRSLVKVSPHGKYISYLAPFQGNLNLWIAPCDDMLAARAVTSSQNPIRDYWWSKNEDIILYYFDQKGDENWQLHGYQLSTGKTHMYTERGLQSRILHISAKHPDKILIGLNQRVRHYIDVYQLDLQSGQMQCIYENNQYWDFIADEDLHLRFGLKVDDKGGEWVDLSLKNQPRALTKIAMHDISGLYFFPRLRLGLSSDNQKLYLTQSMDSNTSTLISIEVMTGKIEKIGHNALADICDVLLNPSTKEPLAFAINHQRKEWHCLNDNTMRDFTYLQSIDDGDIDVISQSEKNDLWLVSFVHDNGPVAFYLYDRIKVQATHLFDSDAALKNFPFTKMHPRIITSRDGLKCVSYLSLPRQSDIQEKGIPFKPVPLILLVHGGPNYRDFWGFNATHQWLANRGYAVLSVNYRASTGFGKAHLDAGHGEWGGKIHHDLLDAIEWAIQEGITTEDKVAIMGRSFGGYATLIGLTLTPDTFCCGVDIVGPSNLETMVKHFPPYWKAMQGAIHEMIGCDPNTEEGKVYLQERSPLHYADRIKKPLLIGHGVNDVRVRQDESDKMVQAMRANGIPVTYAIFPDEGHQFLHPGNRMAFYALAESFLARILGGACEPYDKNVQTTMQVKIDDFELSDLNLD